MTTEFNRRNFLKRGAVTGMVGCALLLSGRLNLLHANNSNLPDLKKLNYCGYQCPSDCQFLVATRMNDDRLKKEVFESWKIKEKYGIDFEPEKIFCWGCKTSDKPAGIVITNCTVRKCAIEKGHDCCIECTNLSKCELELWQQFPDFHSKMIEQQKTFITSK